MPLIGGVGTVLGPAARRGRRCARSTRSRGDLIGGAPGLNLMLYGALLIVILAFLPRRPGGLAAPACAARGVRAMLEVAGIGKRFGGLHRGRDVSLRVPRGRASPR